MSFSDQELKVHKSCCEQIIQDLSKVLSRMDKEESVLTKKYQVLCDSLSVGQDNDSKTRKILVEIEDLKNKLIKFVALKNFIKTIYEKNISREKYIDEIFKSLGIYDQKIDKKVIKNIIKENNNEISATNLVAEQNGEIPFLFYGKKIIKNGDVINFSLPENLQVLSSADDEFILKILKYYPKSMKTINGSILINLKLKNKLLQCLAIYVFDQKKTKSISKINLELGGLLKLSGGNLIENVGDYVFAVENLFNILIKKELKMNHPEILTKIEQTLKCNETSKYLPDDISEV